MTKFSKKEMKKAGKTIRENIKKGKGLIRTINMVDMSGKTHRLNKADYAGLFEAQNVFILKNNRYPNYVTLNSEANNPLVLNYQDDKYSCCVASFNMAVQMLYGWINEDKIKKTFKTDINGTDPSNMIIGAKNLGYNVSRISRNFAGVKQSLNKGYPVIAHIQTKSAKCLGYQNDYGHYVLIYGTTLSGAYKVADPTKGLKVCKANELDKATNGRSINYYSVGIL